jgi:serine/threonine protein kinase
MFNIILFPVIGFISSIVSPIFEKIWMVCSEMLMALEVLHDANIIHRDIKPENIFIDKDGHYVLGLSKFSLIFQLLIYITFFDMLLLM